jgi:hypothetical protein
MHTDFQKRELAVKLVYYGPPLSGKTTNLVKLHERLDPATRGRLLCLETQTDRTLYFDLLPIVFKSQSGLTVKLKLYTVPGQVIHYATRRLVLQGADGVAFVVDSRVSEARAAAESWSDLQKNLRENGIDPMEIPIVVQFNKRDLPGLRSDAEIDELRRRGRHAILLASALRGEGVVETFMGLVERAWARLDARIGLGDRFGCPAADLFEGVARQLAGRGEAP